MSIEYPVDITLKDKTRLSCRPLNEKDIKKLIRFYRNLPEKELSIFSDDRGEMQKEEPFLPDIKNKKFSHLITFNKNRIIAHSTLRMEGMYWQNAAEIMIFVEPEFRRKGLGSQIFDLMLQEGFKSGIAKLIIRYTPDNRGISKILEKYGFSTESVLSQYVEDNESKIHKDLVIASLNLQDWKNKFEFYYSFFELMK